MKIKIKYEVLSGDAQVLYSNSVLITQKDSTLAARYSVADEVAYQLEKLERDGLSRVVAP